jgi:type IV pilus assembly protein PilY1
MNTHFKKMKIFLKCFVAFGLFSSLELRAADPSQEPLFLVAPVKPIMMFNMSKDHQLFFKLYDDYSNITNAAGGAPDPEGIIDTTYNNNFEYFGYFDSKKCYSYDTTNSRFTPAIAMPADNYCQTAAATTKYWSGNFLNWGSMTRVDAIRKILYGGYRSTDTNTLTVLERAFLPNDAHSFAKYYSGDDLPRVTPFASNNGAELAKDRGLTLCNTTEVNVRATYSQNATSANSSPRIRVARGNYSLWASNERWQCRWGTGGNGNNSTLTGIESDANSPASPGLAEYVARVEVCTSAFEFESTSKEQCTKYKSGSTETRKPTGLLQDYSSRVNFALMTGSYGKNKSGGVLRKLAGPIDSKDILNDPGDEITDLGLFKVPSNNQSIINTLSLLKIFGYNFDDGIYNVGDSCEWGHGSFVDGSCSNWGNPQAEIFLESLRYLSGTGKSPSTTFLADDSIKIAGLTSVDTWTDPIDISDTGNKCAPLNILQFNSSTTSYDNNSLGVASDINTITFTEVGIKAATSAIGPFEGIDSSVVDINGNSPSYFIGENGTDNNQLCDAKLINAATGGLGAVQGVCSEAPRLEGGYNIAGLAYLARKNGIGGNRKHVKTHGVVLAPAIPSVTIPVPNAAGDGPDATKKITLLPACRNQKRDGTKHDKDSSCAIVDFKVVSGPTLSGGNYVGSLYVNWEDSEQGGDYDQDMWGMINYSVSSTQATITTRVMAQSTGDPMGFGYVISGTTRDGFHVHSGVNDFIYPSTYPIEPGLPAFVGCTNTAAGRCDCRDDDGHKACDAAIATARSQIFRIGQSAARKLENPLYYAAKWGGYTTDGLTDTQIDATDPTNKTYFYATNPVTLKVAMDELFKSISGVVGSSTTVAANSTSLQGETHIYQARFDSDDWSGQVLDFGLTLDPTTKRPVVSNTPSWDTNNTMARTAAFLSGRRIFTYDGLTTKSVVELTATNWTNADTVLPTLKAALKLSTEADYSIAALRYDWLRGYGEKENVLFRVRARLLGDIINSDPGYAGPGSQRHNNLPLTATSFGASSYLSYLSDLSNASSKNNRNSAVFVGANDGMLHAFNASTGAEMFAYIPRGVYKKLAGLSNINYTHEYTVDGPVYVSDYFRKSDSTWRTIVAGTLGSGGKGAYALDVTDVLACKTGTCPAPTVIFDISDSDTVPATTISGKVRVSGSGSSRTVTWRSGTQFNSVVVGKKININGTDRIVTSVASDKKSLIVDSGPNHSSDVNYSYVVTASGPTALASALGYSNSRVLVLPANADNAAGNGRWVALFSNGTHSLNETASLIAIDVNDPTKYKIIDTGAKFTAAQKALGNENGLSPGAYLPGSQNVISKVYAGDMMGNMWKFDLSNTDMSLWDVAYKSGSTNLPLITAIDASGKAQPITAEPTIGLNSLKLVGGNPSYMVYFVTGKYSEKTDNANTDIQSVYGIADTNAAISINTGNRTTVLHEKTIDSQAAGKRVIKYDKPDLALIWPTKNGWFMDFVVKTGSPLTVGTPMGERGLSKPLLIFDRLIINTFLPSDRQCDYGGSGWLMELVGVGDKFVDFSVLETLANTQLSRPIISDLIALESGNSVVILGSNLGQKKDENPDINDTITVLEGKASVGNRGRMSWRQVK